MALVDEIKFHAKAGRGGDGVVRWRHEKAKEFSGAGGGNGGKGGDVLVRAVRDINVMARYKTSKNFVAKDGTSGMNWSRHGSEGEDCIIELPIGSIVKNTKSLRTFELTVEGQEEKILHGGRGGLGNEHFKASTNVTPEQSTSGVDGEEADFEVELNIIADIGLVGLPNAGKTSLLNALTNSKARVGSYAFTTLDPNLGVLPGGRIVADIPGIIEGASIGKGLGDKFLRHIKRTRMLLHLISVESDDAVADYKVVRNEIAKFGNGLDEKAEMVLLTKIDAVDAGQVKKIVTKLKKCNPDVLTVTVLDDQKIKDLRDEILKRCG